MALFSRYSHRNCIINCKCGCQGCRMECPGEDLGRLNFPRLSQGRAWEFSQHLACWIEMFSVYLPTALAQGALIFWALFSLSAWCLCSNSGICAAGTAPDRYIRSAGSFIIVHTRPRCFSLCNQKECLRYMWYWLSCCEKSQRDTNYHFNRNTGSL